MKYPLLVLFFVFLVLTSFHEGIAGGKKESPSKHREVFQAEYDDSDFEDSKLKKAVEAGEKGVVIELLNKHDNVPRDSDGHSLLHIAAERGFVEIAKVLIDKEPGLLNDGTISGGTTPLMLAAAKGHVAMADLLINNEANVGKKDEKGRSAFFLAAENGQKEMVETLLKPDRKKKIEINIDERNEEGVTPLLSAIENGHKSVALRLIEGGAGIEQLSKEGKSPLYAAAQRGYSDLVERLLRGNANPHRRTFEGKSILSVSKDPKVFKLVSEAIQKSPETRISGITCPTEEKDQVNEKGQINEKEHASKEEIQKLIVAFTEHQRDHVVGDYNLKGTGAGCRFDEHKQGSLSPLIPGGGRILVLGSDNSGYEATAKQHGAMTYQGLDLRPLNGTPAPGILEKDDWQNTLVHKMLYTTEEIHFFLAGSYPDIRNSKEKIQHMVDQWATHKSKFVTDWEMWMIHCSSFAPLLKLKLMYH